MSPIEMMIGACHYRRKKFHHLFGPKTFYKSGQEQIYKTCAEYASACVGKHFHIRSAVIKHRRYRSIASEKCER